MLGPDPETMGFIKNIYWGNLREDMILPYPEESKNERERCDKLLTVLDAHFKITLDDPFWNFLVLIDLNSWMFILEIRVKYCKQLVTSLAFVFDSSG